LLLPLGQLPPAAAEVAATVTELVLLPLLLFLQAAAGLQLLPDACKLRAVLCTWPDTCMCEFRQCPAHCSVDQTAGSKRGATGGGFWTAAVHSMPRC
jgi:hypothetical protein